MPPTKRTSGAVKADGASAADSPPMSSALAAPPTEASRQYLGVFYIFFLGGLFALLFQTGRSLPGPQQVLLGVNLALSCFAYYAVSRLTESPFMASMFIDAGLKGIDLNKVTTRRDKETGALVRPIDGKAIPESQGAISATIYIIVLSILIPVAFGTETSSRLQTALEGIGQHMVESTRSVNPHEHLSEYLAALLSIALGAFLGFADDVLDLRWRHKIPLPLLANLPLLLVYHAGGGLTGVTVPNQLQTLFGTSYLELSLGFYAFLLGLALVSTHAINIYSGVNGLEAGQSVIIAASIVTFNAIQLVRTASLPADGQVGLYQAQHIMSLVLTLPFLLTTMALLRQNWFPSRVFVGDTLPYLAGSLFAAVSIVGHFSKMMVLLLLPQIINALFSVPQVLRWIPIPRHRMPGFDQHTGLVKASYTDAFCEKDLKILGRATMWVLRTFRLADIQVVSRDAGTVRVTNLTLNCLCLYWFGDCREDILCVKLMLLQALCTMLAFAVRFGLTRYFFDVVR